MARTTRADTIEARENEVAVLIGVLKYIEVLTLLRPGDEDLILVMLRAAAQLKCRIIAERQRSIHRGKA